tara:strand:- start:478 stop:657 length:180 start_codon:yes stop_codon:yes gene_type:complete
MNFKDFLRKGRDWFMLFGIFFGLVAPSINLFDPYSNFLLYLGILSFLLSTIGYLLGTTK